MHFLNTLTEFIRDLQAQKLRAFLTIFGITWGTVAVIVLLAFGTGFKRQTSVNMHGIGEGIVIMFPGRTAKTFEGLPDGRRISFVEEDAVLLKRQVRDIAKISPEYSDGSIQAKYGVNIQVPTTTGIYPIYADMRNIMPQPGGRWINELDLTWLRQS